MTPACRELLRQLNFMCLNIRSDQMCVFHNDLLLQLKMSSTYANRRDEMIKPLAGAEKAVSVS